MNMKGIGRVAAIVLVFAAGFVAGTYFGAMFDDLFSTELAAKGSNAITHPWWYEALPSWDIAATLLLGLAGLLYTLTREPKNQEHDGKCASEGCGRMPTVLELFQEDAQPQFRGVPATEMTFAMLTDRAQEMVRRFGSGVFISAGGKTGTAIFPPGE